VNNAFIKKKDIHSFIGSLEFKLEDHIHYPLYNWPLTPVTYRVDFSGGSVRAEELVLLFGSKQMPCQFSDIFCRVDGTVLKADITFMTDLPSGGSRIFRLEKGTPVVFEHPVTVTETDDGFILSNSLIQLKLPKSCEFPQNPSGPVTAITDKNDWIGNSQLISGGRRVTQIKTSCVESGAVFAHFSVEYVFEGSGIYRADIGLCGGLDFITLDEQVSGIDSDEQVYWRFDLTGFEPTHRYAPNNPGRFREDPLYQTFEDYPWHKIDEPYVDSFTHPMDLPTVGEHGELPFRLNVFETTNAVARNKNACFWDERSCRSVGIFLLNCENWDNERYDIFTSWDGSAIKYFYEDSKLWWRFPVANGTRSIGLTVYDHEKDKACFFEVIERLKGFDGFPAPKLGLFAVSYANYLENWYNTLNLDKVKEYTLTYPKEARRAEKICSSPSSNSPDAMLEHMFTYLLVPSLPLYGATVNCGFSGVPYRRMSDQYFSTYNMIYDRFSDAQREQAEAILLLLIYLAQGECCTPMFVMHGGPPNLLSDVKCSLATAGSLFPEHPDYELFMQTFEKLIPLTSKFMTRPPLKQFMLRGGRWAENLGLYVWAYLHTLDAHAIARFLGGRKNTACTPETEMLAQFLLHSLTAPFNGDNPQTLALHLKNDRYWSKDCWPKGKESRRLHPPQGAHSARRSPPNSMWHLALALERYAPLTAENLRYISHYDDIEAEAQSRSKLFEALSEREKRDGGTRPEFRSCAFTGYGVVLRSAVETENEVSVHLQQIDGGPNYRWGTVGIGGNGAIYYYAAGKAYSHNGTEEIGDGMFNDCDAGCMLGAWKGFKYRSIGPNVMTNGYFDMGGFQFAKIDSEVCPDSYGWPEYQSRSVTLSHSDYILIYDAVGSTHTKTRFAWDVALYDDFPDIQILTKTDNRWELFTPESKSVWYHGMGDSVALVTHKNDIKAEYTDGCAVVRCEGKWTDYIMRSKTTVQVDCDGIVFKGTSGAARVYADGTYSLALFDGCLLAYKDIKIETKGEKQVAVSLDEFHGYTIEGRIVSLFDSSVCVKRENCDDNIYIDGKKAVLDEQGFIFVPKGEHKLSLTQAGHLPVPTAPQIKHITTGSGQADIKWLPVNSAEKYTFEMSIDGGRNWVFAAEKKDMICEINGLENEAKYHFRVTAQNAEHCGAPSHEYPANISREVPLSPDGLTLEFTAGGELLSWGEILGACGYALYARNPQENFRFLYKGDAREFNYQKMGTDIEQFAVAAINLNGEGSLSNIIDDNPESLANWSPDKKSFDRNSLYNHHPFYALNIHQCRPSPEQYPCDTGEDSAV